MIKIKIITSSYLINWEVNNLFRWEILQNVFWSRVLGGLKLHQNLTKTV